MCVKNKSKNTLWVGGVMLKSGAIKTIIGQDNILQTYINLGVLETHTANDVTAPTAIETIDTTSDDNTEIPTITTTEIIDTISDDTTETSAAQTPETVELKTTAKKKK